MIAHLSGTILSKSLKSLVISAHGVGYRVAMSLSDLAQVGSVGQNIEAHIYTNVRDDAIELFGFLREDNLQTFESLISVSGIGPKLALALLSGMNGADIHHAITQGNHQALTQIPGIGGKTAQRIVLELKDRFKISISSDLSPSVGILQDLRSAILHLGYKTQAVERVVQHVEPMAKRGDPLPALVKEAIKHLSDAKAA